jgi:formate-dependent nitrite reductase cytochrome c552 subunit
MKVCRHCGQQKPTNDFRPNPRCGDGLSSWCANCHDEASARSKEKRAEREAPIIEAQRKEAHAKWMAEWRASMAQRKKQIARNRRALEAKSRKAAA